MLAVFRMSTEYVIEDVLMRTPVDTGYMRASFTVSLDGPLPIRADARPPSDAEKDSYKPQPYSLAINGADLGDTITASFVAAYSAHVEYGARGREGVGMVRLAAQAWPQHVAKAVAEAKARVASNAQG